LAPLHGEGFRKVFSRSTPADSELALRAAYDRGQDVLMPGMHAFLVDTLQVTQLATSSASTNVTGAQAWATLDVRLLPETDQESFLADLRAALGPHVEVTVELETGPTPQSSTDTSTYAAMARILGGNAPVIPTFILGTTDSRLLRQRGITAYGLSPFILNGEDLRGIHGPDESIPLSTFVEGVERMKELVEAVLARAPESES
jgi:acetylornithine deacetylase/succinyl-diaminopimelate desuccinylase-like protein